MHPTEYQNTSLDRSSQLSGSVRLSGSQARCPDSFAGLAPRNGGLLPPDEREEKIFFAAEDHKFHD